MPNRKAYRLRFRPRTYWPRAKNLLANIKGQRRREMVQRALEEGRIDEVPTEILGESLSDATRAAVGQMHPANMGGEYLPDCAKGEVEIARVTLASTTADVMSLRARRARGKIRYRWVDEYEQDYDIPRGKGASDKPLSLGELINLIDRTQAAGFASGMTNSIRDFQVEDRFGPPEDLSEDLEAIAEFVSVSSPFYPQREAWFEEEAAEWLAERLKECSADGDE